MNIINGLKIMLVTFKSLFSYYVVYFITWAISKSINQRYIMSYEHLPFISPLQKHGRLLELLIENPLWGNAFFSMKLFCARMPTWTTCHIVWMIYVYWNRYSKLCIIPPSISGSYFQHWGSREWQAMWCKHICHYTHIFQWRAEHE